VKVNHVQLPLALPLLAGERAYEKQEMEMKQSKNGNWKPETELETNRSATFCSLASMAYKVSHINHG